MSFGSTCAPCANENASAIAPRYACEPDDLSLSCEGYSEYSGSLVFWLVDADGRCVDDGESAIECRISCDLEGGAVQWLDVYAPDGNAIELHADSLALLQRSCELWWDAQTDDDAAEARYESRRGWL